MDWTLNPESSPETLDIKPSTLYTLLQEEDLIFRKLVFDAVNKEIEKAASVARRGEGARRQVMSMVRGLGFDAGSRVHADIFFVWQASQEKSVKRAVAMARLVIIQIGPGPARVKYSS